ncbi:hypothetical protein AAC387_Pa02g3921 [Persea americana]
MYISTEVDRSSLVDQSTKKSVIGGTRGPIYMPVSCFKFMKSKVRWSSDLLDRFKFSNRPLHARAAPVNHLAATGAAPCGDPTSLSRSPFIRLSTRILFTWFLHHVATHFPARWNESLGIDVAKRDVKRQRRKLYRLRQTISGREFTKIAP